MLQQQYSSGCGIGKIRNKAHRKWHGMVFQPYKLSLKSYVQKLDHTLQSVSTSLNSSISLPPHFASSASHLDLQEVTALESK